MTSFSALGNPTYVSLTTFRKNGVAVPTAVWAAPDGDALVVTTVGSAGKVKRLRNNPTVTLQPCSMRGTVKDGAVTVTGTAEIITDPARIDELGEALAKKYGFQYRLAMRSARRRKDEPSDRVILLITPS